MTALKAGLLAEAERQGFVAVAVTDATVAHADREVTLDRVRRGRFSGLPWFDEERVVRATDPRRTLREARSVVVLAASYAHRAPHREAGLRGRIARYAWGRDYHVLLKRRARRIARWIDRQVPGARSHWMTDSGPLAERAFARSGGLGWQGKNTMLLRRGLGSYTLLAAVLTTAEIEPDPPVAQGCGSCARCLPSCPTGALAAPYDLANDLCISYQTIENHGPIPRALRARMGDWVFGCDLCQEACPVNEGVEVGALPELAPRSAEAAFPDLVSALALDDDGFRERFRGRPILRARHAGFLRNVCVALGNSADPRAVTPLGNALEHAEPLVRGHAAWALGRLGAERLLRARRPREDDAWVREEIDAALEAIGG